MGLGHFAATVLSDIFSMSRRVSTWLANASRAELFIRGTDRTLLPLPARTRSVPTTLTKGNIAEGQATALTQTDARLEQHLEDGVVAFGIA